MTFQFTGAVLDRVDDVPAVLLLNAQSETSIKRWFSSEMNTNPMKEQKHQYNSSAQRRDVLKQDEEFEGGQKLHIYEQVQRCPDRRAE